MDELGDVAEETDADDAEDEAESMTGLMGPLKLGEANEWFSSSKVSGRFSC